MEPAGPQGRLMLVLDVRRRRLLVVVSPLGLERRAALPVVGAATIVIDADLSTGADPLARDDHHAVSELQVLRRPRDGAALEARVRLGAVVGKATRVAWPVMAAATRGAIGAAQGARTLCARREDAHLVA